jgi:hypothetical protein
MSRVTTQVIPQSRVVYSETVIEIRDCPECGVTYGLGLNFIESRKEDEGTWYCPNGHPRYYPKQSTEHKLREELAEQKRRTQAERDYASRERERRLVAERQRAAAKGQVTKIKNRIANGVCPCCNRTFQNVARHMASQHPDYTVPA